MRQGLFKYSISYFFIILFLLVKMTGLHGLFHDTDKKAETECSICLHHISYSQIAITLPADIETVEVPNWDYIFTIFVGELPKVDYKSDSRYQYFSRPPPSLI